jgi:hypothetical protein
MGGRTKTKRRPPRAVPEAAPPAAISRFARFERRPIAFLAVSLIILLPCFWQSRIQAGDLASHVYNAWLAQLVAKGQAPGLAIRFQTTNVLFDLLLGGLFSAFGPGPAQRIAVCIAVLVFFWGAFAFVAVVSRGAWQVAPAIAMLTYGWVFHMGFFNFYLSLGICFWALAVAWNGGIARSAAAVPLLALAYVAHALPVAWTVAVLAYVYAWRSGFRRYLFWAGLGGVVVLSAAIVVTLNTRWLTAQIWRVTSADQLWVYGNKYLVAAGCLAAVWILVAVDRWRLKRLEPTGPLLPVCLLTAAGIVAIPSVIWLPHYNHPLAFVADRMSLPLGILVCGLLAQGRVRLWQTGGLALAAALFFGFLYVDETVLNEFEDGVDQVVAQLPPNQRVVLSVIEDGIQVNAIVHTIDRACIGHCWSSANYEPSSGQFRIRAVGDTGLAAPTNPDADALQTGGYIVRPSDLPLFQILPIETGGFEVRRPAAGTRLGVRLWRGL